MLTITSSLVVEFGDKNSFISSMRKETFLALFAMATLLEKPARRIVDESTHLVALSALSFQVEFADSFRIRTLFSLSGPT